jgi:hypothetical protein
MYTGQHFTSFSGSVRESERQGVIERKIFVEAGNTLQLPPPTPAAVLLARWEGSGSTSPVEDDAPDSPVLRTPSTAPSTAQRAGAQLSVSRSGPHSARSQASSVQREATATPRRMLPLAPPRPSTATMPVHTWVSHSSGSCTPRSELEMGVVIPLDEQRGSSFNHSLTFLGGSTGHGGRLSLEDSERRSAHPLEPAKPPGSLPPGWTERMSKSQPGRKFFHNRARREATWVRPDVDGKFPDGTQFFSSKTREAMSSPRTRPYDGGQPSETPGMQNPRSYVARAPVSGFSSAFPHLGCTVVPNTPVGVKIGRSVAMLESLGDVDRFAGASGYFDISSGRNVGSTGLNEAAEAAAKMRASMRAGAAGVAGASTGGASLPGAMDTWAGQVGGSPVRR